MKLKELIDKLTAFTQLTKNGKLHASQQYLNGYGSYRGYYEDLYIELEESPGRKNKDSSPTTLQEFVDVLNTKVLNKTFVGYKGGDFLMNEKVDVYLSYYGGTGSLVEDVVMDSTGNVKLI
jgi:hypothetical protein